jgi:hypothetical protein
MSFRREAHRRRAKHYEKVTAAAGDITTRWFSAQFGAPRGSPFEAHAMRPSIMIVSLKTAGRHPAPPAMPKDPDDRLQG